MTTKTKTLTTFVLVVLSLCLFTATQTAAQSTNSTCKKIQGNSVASFNPATGTVSGPVTNAGILNGTLEDVINFAAGFIFTPDPTVVSYTTNLTITTLHGQLKASPVTTQSIVTAAGSEWAHINPDASTGKFAGATGMILIRFRPVGDPGVGPFDAELSGEICLASNPD